MTVLEFFNHYLFQFFFFRLARFEQFNEERVITDRGWCLIYFILPFTGWDNDYKYLGKRRCTYLRLYKKKVIFRNPGEPYLIRYTLLTCRWFSVKIHNILLSDPSCMHDHPWAFITFLFKGGYVEHTPKGSKVYGRFSFLYRPASYTHKLEIHQPVWSFVVTFKKVKKWGFFTPTGWVEWFKYNYKINCD